MSELGVFTEHLGGGLMEGIESARLVLLQVMARSMDAKYFVFSQDFTVLGGSLGKMNAQRLPRSWI
ncbi:MAG: hypothetical protein R2865_17360 [Deinococcales bacterium]